LAEEKNAHFRPIDIPQSFGMSGNLGHLSGQAGNTIELSPTKFEEKVSVSPEFLETGMVCMISGKRDFRGARPPPGITYTPLQQF
jgi:hypothetical protein